MNEHADMMETVDPELEAQLRRTLAAVAATVTDDQPPGLHEVRDMLSKPRRQPGRQRWLAAVAAVLVAVIVGAATLRDATVHPAAELAAGTWSPMKTGPLSARFAPSVVWTGTEMVVFGGYDQLGTAMSDGAAYNPSTNTWRFITPMPGVTETEPWPWSRSASPAVVVGDQIVTFGHPVDNDDSGWGWDLVAYDLIDDSWATLDQNRFDQLPSDEVVPTAGAATVHSPHSMVSWDDELVVFGSRSDLGFGWARFDPIGRSWSEFTAVEGVEGSYGPSVGSPAVVDDRYFVLLLELGAPNPNLGVVIDLERDTAQPIPSPAAPEGEVADDPNAFNFGIWSNGTAGTAMAGIAISNEGQAWRVAASLDPTSGRLTQAAAPSDGPLDDGPAAMVKIPGGYLTLGGLTMTGGRHGGLKVEAVFMAADDELSRWVDMPEPPIDLNRTGHVAIWTGEQVIVWGGATATPGGPVNRADRALSDGALFNPGSPSD